MEKKYYVLTVDRCHDGKRGILVSINGEKKTMNPVWKEEPYTEEEITEFLGPFEMILSPIVIKMTQAEVVKHNSVVPLEEYQNQYGIATIPEEVKS